MITAHTGFTHQIAVLATSLALVSMMRADEPKEDSSAFTASYKQWRQLQNESKFQDAAKAAESCLKQATSLYGADHANTARVLCELGELRTIMGNFSAAEAQLKKSLRIREVTPGSDSVDTAETLFQMGRLYQIMRENKQGLEALDRCLTIRKSKLGAEHPEVGRALGLKAEMLSRQGDYALAENCGRDGLKFCQAVLPPDDPAIAEVAVELARVLLDRGRYQQAGEFAQQALRVDLDKFGARDVRSAKAQSLLSSIQGRQGHFAQAELLAQASLKTRQELLGPDHLLVAISLNDLSNLHVAQAKYSEAATELDQGLKISEAVFGKDHPALALMLDNRAVIASKLKDYPAAIQLSSRALDIERRKLGKSDDDTLRTQSNLASFYSDSGRIKEAVDLMEEGLKALEKKADANQEIMGAFRNNLANVLLRTGERERGQALIQQALDDVRKTAGPESPFLVSLLANMSTFYMAANDLVKAEQAAREGLKLADANLGIDHPETARILSQLSKIMMAEEKWDEARAFRERSRRAYHSLTFRILPGLSETEQYNFSRNQTADLYAGLQMAFFRKDDPKFTNASAEWLINGKSLVYEVMAQQIAAGRIDGDPAIKKLNNELVRARQRLSETAMNVPSLDKIDARKKEIDALQQECERLSRQLAGQSSSHLSDKWIELAEIQQLLPPRTVLVELGSCYTAPSFNSKERAGFRYLAWIIRPIGEGPLEFVDLGEADRLDQTIRMTREAIEETADMISRSDEATAEASLKGPLRALSSMLLKPLEKTLDNVDHVYICPDRELWLVPWSALLRNDKYLVETHSISLLLSSRQLLDLPSAAARSNKSPALIVANPNYDLGLKQEADSRIAFRKLPGTAKEAQAVVPWLKILTGVDPVMLQQDDATETKLRSITNPRILILSTHGFVFPGSSTDHTIKLLEQNPFLQCGLALAGANDSQRALHAQDDGLLLGSEVLGLRLEGTQLVVLSACETGIGRLLPGEGVAGLRQAFHLAGAPQVVSTLWSIPDAETADWMAAFFTSYAKNSDAGQALRDAQLSIIGERRKKNKAAHPMYWAAFTVSGNPLADLSGKSKTTPNRSNGEDAKNKP